MANNNPDFHSITGAMESTEPAAANTSAQRSPSQQRQASSATSNNPSTTTSTTSNTASSSTSTSIPQLRRQPSASLLPSNGSSPQSSRNVSPIRRDNRPGPLAGPISTQPSAAAIQRALSAASVPQLPAGPVSEAVSRLPRAPKSTGAGGSGDNTPQWPLSPRLKSPPPSAVSSRRGSSAPQKKTNEPSAAPSISVQSPTPQTSTPPPPKPNSEEPRKGDIQLQAPPKASSRGPSGKSTLETVQEASSDSISESPAAVQAAADLKPLTRINEEDKSGSGKREGSEADKPTESGSESAGNKSDGKRGRRQSVSQASINTTRSKNAGKSSYPPLTSAKSRQAEGKQNMTVETETVQSIPQSALGSSDRAGGGRNENGGSVRLKPSNETIRPKKERKRASQKARSINQGTVSSKADIFEARVASAVDEANTSDSDETFVYESNPPEPQRRPRHHSRTPSVTSAHSMADQQRGGIRNFGDMMDERRVAGKRSMKFSNNSYNDVDSPDSKNGTVRSHKARHFGKFGRGASHASMYDPESPFTQASKLRTSHLNSRSRPNSPRSPQSMQQQSQQMQSSGLFGRKLENSFDFDGEGADDERTPLVGTVRTPRNARQHRRHNSGSVRSIDEYYSVRERSRCGRLGGCLLGFCVLFAVILSAVAFLMMSNRPLYEVSIDQIQNVLASEEEIMMDLRVGAINPNALGITMMDMDVHVFAKSIHAGSNEYWREHGHADSDSNSRRKGRRRQEKEGLSSSGVGPNPWQDLSGHWHTPDNNVGPDPSNPPDDHDQAGDVDRDAQTMLLGRITHFDQALSFEGSPIKRHPHYALGQLRLMKPGNKTESGGSERWEHVLQHSFELIIRGVLQYQLPISSRTQTAAVGASVLVHPEEGVDEFGNMRVEQIKQDGDWLWIDWEDYIDDRDKNKEKRGRVTDAR